MKNRLHRPLSPLITASRFHTRAQALKNTLCVLKCSTEKKFLKFLNLVSAVERVWLQHASRWGGEQVYRGSRNPEQRRWRLKKVSIKKAPAVRSEQAAASVLPSEPWAQSACLSYCLFVPPRAPTCKPLCSLLLLAFGGKSMYLLMLFRIPNLVQLKKKSIYFHYLLFFSFYSQDSSSPTSL